MRMYVATNPAPFKKFLEPFLCFVGISCYYTLDEGCYPTYWDKEDQEMDLFAFIRHTDPTKVRIGERDVREGEVSLLELTRGRVDQVEHGSHVVNVGGIDIMGDDWLQAIVVDQPKRVRKKRKDADGASGSGLPLKKLREDHSIFGDVGATAATLPFVTSSVTPTPERESDGPTDSVTVFYSGSYYTTTAVATTVITDTFALVPMAGHGSGAGKAWPCIFKDFVSPSVAEADVASPSQPVGTELSAGSFYVSQDMDSDTLRRRMQLLRGKLRLWSLATSKDAKLASSNSQVVKMTQDLSNLQLSCDELKVKASSIEFEKDNLVNQVSEQETTGSGLRDKVIGYKLFKEWVEEVQDEQVRVLSDRVAGGALGRAIDNGMQDGLKAGVDHGRAKRGLDVIASYDPSAEANFIFAVDVLRDVDFPLLTQLVSRKDASMAEIFDLLRLECHAVEIPEASQLQPFFKQLMVPIHRLEDQVIIKETFLSFALDVAYSRVQRLKGDASACRLSLTEAMVSLLEPLSVRSLTGEASTSMAPSAAVTTALLNTFGQASNIPSLPYTQFPPSPKIVFKEEELNITPEHTSFVVVLSLYHDRSCPFARASYEADNMMSFALSFVWLASLFWYTRSPGLKLVLQTLELQYFSIFALLLASWIAACSLLLQKVKTDFQGFIILYHVYFSRPEGGHTNFR
uniref:Transposase (Putative), gypsy type n=1 Tax=Tanacetum cinerariifolium TaxID=118510 RepID=A0A6L2K5S2_TANCI|nr:transposase (putative), gypsy type [Tanacetum cinerariifolium]